MFVDFEIICTVSEKPASTSIKTYLQNNGMHQFPHPPSIDELKTCVVNFGRDQAGLDFVKTFRTPIEQVPKPHCSPDVYNTR